MKNTYLYVCYIIFTIFKYTTQEREVNLAPYPTAKTAPLFELNGDFNLLSDQLPSCQVNDKNKCILILLVKNTIYLNNFVIESSDETKIKIRYKELCKNFEKYEKCKEVKKFIDYSNQIEIYTIHLEPITVGKAWLMLRFDLKNGTVQQKHFLNHSMSISQKQRLDETIFDNYSLAMETLISLFLGFSFDIQIILSNVKHPKNFFIGFACMIFLMPLVNLF